MAASLAPAPTTNPLRRIAFDLSTERAARSSGIPFPPGPMSFSLVRTRRFSQNPLPILLRSYERYGPVFSLRLLHSPVVALARVVSQPISMVSWPGSPKSRALR